MSPRRLLQPQWWASHWPNAVLYMAVTGVFVLTVWIGSMQRSADNARDRRDVRSQWEANVRFCQSGNERTAVLRDFLLAATAEPDPKQFDFITDPQLRAGALEQARRSRGDMRDRVARTFVPRDCAAEFPSPPGE